MTVNTIMEGDTFVTNGFKGFHTFKYGTSPAYVRFGLRLVGKKNSIFLQVDSESMSYAYVPIRMVLTEKTLKWERYIE